MGREYKTVEYIKPNAGTYGPDIRICELRAVIICDMTAGSSAKKIGKKLGKSYRTIEGHQGLMREQIGCENMKDFIATCTERGLHIKYKHITLPVRKPRTKKKK